MTVPSDAQVGEARPSGALHLRVVRRGGVELIDDWPQRELTIGEILTYGAPQQGLPVDVNDWRRRNLRNLWRGARRVLTARALKLPHFYGQLFLSVQRADGDVVSLGLASMRVVTSAGVKYLTDDIAGGANDANLFKFHGLGTGSTAEAASDTALVTELTTQYNPDNTRATGSQVSGTSGANATYTTVGTNTVDATAAVQEHGILTQAATGGGTLLDRSVFTTVNLASGDSLQTTYVLTVNSGG